MESFANYLKLLAFSPILVMGIHALLIRICRIGRIQAVPQIAAGFSILLGLPLAAVFSWFIFFQTLPAEDRLGAGLYGFLVYGGLSYSYFHLFNLSETARRLRILYVLVSKRKMGLKELNAYYGQENMVSTRLMRLVETGQLRREGGFYFLKRRLLLYVAHAVMGWRKFLRINF